MVQARLEFAETQHAVTRQCNHEKWWVYPRVMRGWRQVQNTNLRPNNDFFVEIKYSSASERTRFINELHESVSKYLSWKRHMQYVGSFDVPQDSYRLKWRFSCRNYWLLLQKNIKASKRCYEK